MGWSAKTNTLVRIGGAINAVTGQFHYKMGPHFGGSEFASFIKDLAASYKIHKKVYVIIDNVSLHFTKEVRAVTEKNKNLELVHLPSYSPWLNNIEKVWKWMKQRVVHAHPWCNNFKEFKNQVRTTLESINDNRREVLQYAGLCSN